MPAFNAERFVAQAIESAIMQTHNNIEIILVDDGSTDRTGEIARSYPKVNYIHQENQGVAAARNKALTHVKGDFVAFLDADDLYRPDKLEKQLKLLLSDPSIDCCITGLSNFIEVGCIMDKEIEHYFVHREKINVSSTFVRSEVFARVGNFNTSYRIGSDFEWITRAVEQKLKIDIMPEVLMERRIHGNNLTLLRQKEDKSVRLRMLKESLVRRREQETNQ